MLKLVIICTVCFLTKNSKSHSLSNSDISKILDVLRNNRDDSTSSDESNSEADADYDYDRGEPKSLRTKDVLDLIKKHNSKHQYRLRNKNQNLQSYPEKHNEKYQSNVLKKIPAFDNKGKKKSPHRDAFNQHLLHQILKNHGVPKKNLQRYAPKPLLTPVTLKDKDERGQIDGLNEYSKIFVLLDPNAIRNENKMDLKRLVSKIITASSATNEKSRQERNKGQLYRSFGLNDDLLSRRYRRNSKETFANSMSEEVKRRPKNDYGSGGGSGGRTAIPYVRLRGDIYERDH